MIKHTRLDSTHQIDHFLVEFEGGEFEAEVAGGDAEHEAEVDVDHVPLDVEEYLAGGQR